MPQLDPTWFASQIFWLAIAFAVLYGVLARLALPPLQAVIDRREKTAADDISQAQRLKSQADHARQEYERALADARERAQQLMNAAMLDQKNKTEQLNKDMDRQVAAKFSEAEKKITARKEDLLNALQPSTAELASMIVEKLTQKKPGMDQLSRVIGDILNKSGNR